MGDANLAVPAATDEHGHPTMSGPVGTLVTNDGRVPDARPVVLSRDLDAHMPPEARANWSAVCAEQFGGDWDALAASFDRQGATTTVPTEPRMFAVMAAWARHMGDQGEQATTLYPGAGIASTTDGRIGQPAPEADEAAEAEADDSKPPTGRQAPSKSTTSSSK